MLGGLTQYILKLREFQQSLIRTTLGVLRNKILALSSIYARSGFIRCTLASAYLLDVFSLPDEFSEQTYTFLPYSVFNVLSLEGLL